MKVYLVNLEISGKIDHPVEEIYTNLDDSLILQEVNIKPQEEKIVIKANIRASTSVGVEGPIAKLVHNIMRDFRLTTSETLQRLTCIEEAFDAQFNDMYLEFEEE